VVGKTDFDFFSAELAAKYRADELRVMESGLPLMECEERTVDHQLGQDRWFLTSKVPWRDRHGKTIGIVGIARDITERKQLEVELRHAQKLEAVGGLAAGIAHELNTPIQFVGDNTHFLQDAFTDLAKVLTKYRQLREGVAKAGVGPTLVEEVREVEEAADLGYLLEEIPKALAQSLEGVSRVATIVHAMKEFAHPDRGEKMLTDLNKALASTLIVARNEIKYVADVDTDFGELPLVLCYGSDMNQVFLNLLVNAAHAIREAAKGSDKRGLIRVRTRQESNHVVISISDTGCGIPENIRHKIFEPFFTTKEVGRGTGQGLTIARTIVVEKHGGSLTFDTELGQGTTFTIRLPLELEAEPK
jgi:signal transduction histidine kinase